MLAGGTGGVNRVGGRAGQGEERAATAVATGGMRNASGISRTLFVRPLGLALLVAALLLLAGAALAQAPDRPPGPEVPRLPRLTFLEGTDNPEDVTLAIKFIFLLTFLSIAPSLIMMVTCFLRITIVLTFIKRAMGTQDLPPAQVIATLALFLTFFVMAPTIKEIKEVAWDPYQAKEITTLEAYERGIGPVRNFMLRQTRPKDLALFIGLSGMPRPRNVNDVPTWLVVPAFMISELTTAFLMGVYIFLPFIVIDMVVASILMSMGMIMLPPVMISLPFKILLFVLVDGWNLIAVSLVRSFGQ